MKAKVSVIVPIYNVAPYLPECLDSILAQTMGELEVILINDGSTDSSGSIADDYAKQDPRISVIHQENHGLSFARNKGLEEANAVYVMFIDSDDWIDTALIENLYKRALETKADLIACNFQEEYNYHSSEPSLELTGEIVDINYEHRSSIYYRLLSPKTYSGYVWNKLYRLSIIQQYGLQFVDNKKVGGEDGLFNLCFMLHLKRAASIQKPVYHYRQRSSSIMHTVRPEIISQYVSLIKSFVRYVAKHNMQEELEGTLPFIAYHYFYMGLQHNVNLQVPRKKVLDQIRQASIEPVFRELMGKLIRIQVLRKNIYGSPQAERMFRRVRTTTLAFLCLAGMHRTLYYTAKCWLWWLNRFESFS